MIRRTPAFPLFPYTTLFRSGVVLKAGEDGPREGTRVVGLAGQGGWAERVVVPTSRLAVLPDDEPRGRDRKSTRLNSSHPSISYAVFCLKKNTTPVSLVRCHS